MLVKIKIIVSGGFHRVSAKAFGATLTDYGYEVSPTTACKMQRYACGISSCCCDGLALCRYYTVDSLARARITDNQGNRLCVTYRYASGLPRAFAPLEALVD